ncbi:putative ribonuclease H-like domain-containing protein, partial [Tanacetum coccineum]
MCDKKNNVLFTKTGCLVLSPNFKLLDESQALLKVSRQNNMYSFDLKNVVPSGGLTCLFAKATIDESNLWHRRLGHINFKPMNKLVRGNLVRGLPSKLFENDHTCVACQKEKQHKASCKTKLVSSISQPLQMLHMDLFGPTSKEGEASNKEGDQDVQDLRAELDKLLVQQKEGYANSTNRVSSVSPSVSAAGKSFVNYLPTDPLMLDLEETTDLLNIGIFSGAYDNEDVGAEADLN